MSSRRRLQGEAPLAPCDAARVAPRMDAVLRAGIVESERKQGVIGTILDRGDGAAPTADEERALTRAYLQASLALDRAMRELAAATRHYETAERAVKKDGDSTASPGVKWALFTAQKAFSSATVESTTAREALDKAGAALDAKRIPRPSTAAAAAAPPKRVTGEDRARLLQRFRHELPNGDEGEFDTYYAPFRRRFPNVSLDPYYTQFRELQLQREVERAQFLSRGGSEMQYELQYGKLQEARDKTLAGWLATHGGRSFADAERDAGLQAQLGKLLEQAKKDADNRFNLLSTRSSLNDTQQAELAALKEVRRELQQDLNAAAQRRASAGGDVGQQRADVAHQERLRRERERRLVSVREQVREQVEGATLDGMSYDAARRADEEWYAQAHATGPMPVELAKWRNFLTVVPGAAATDARGNDKFSVTRKDGTPASKAAIPFTTGQMGLLFQTKRQLEMDATPRAASSSGRAAAPLGVSAAQVAERQAALGMEPLVWNAEFARILLREHVSALADMHADQMRHEPRARFIDVAGALGADRDVAVAQLLPTFRALCEYKSTMLWVKRLQLEQSQQLQLVTDRKGAEDDRRALAELRPLTSDDPQWKIYAQRLIDAEEGRLPGQLYFPQPYYLPLRIAAPPRVGKSACALLVASLARRLEMTVLYSVSPNKLTPIQEMQTKLHRLGWFDQERRGADYKGLHHQMDLRTFSIERLPDKCGPDPRKVDFVLYSSDVLSDCQRAGAVLAGLRRSSQVVLHLRDEAQSLAKAIGNDTVSCHKYDVPPKPELQYLREYYGNYYGLSCNITATHFPTLLEEPMWGFLGSVGQLTRAGVPAESWRDVKAIDALLGAEFLPELVPALRPSIPPGYMGVERLRAWVEDGRRKPTYITRNTKSAAAASRAATSGPGLEEFEVQPPADEPDLGDDGEPELTDAQRERRLAYADELTPAQLRTREIVDDPTNRFEPPPEDDGAEAAADRRERLERNRARYESLFGKGGAEEEIKALGRHFSSWMRESEQDVGAWRATPTVDGEVLVPTLIAALNSRIENEGMASWLRYYGQLAHRLSFGQPPDLLALSEAHAGRTGGGGGAAGKKGKKKQCPAMATPSTCFDPMDAFTGVAFLFYTSVIDSRDTLARSKIEHSNSLTGAAVPKITPDAGGLLLCIYRWASNTDVAENQVPRFEVWLARDAEQAMGYAYRAHRIRKCAVLGYGMLKAGLTVQVRLQEGTEAPRHYCPRYLAISTSGSTPLDTQLQVAGRCFVDLKDLVAPEKWAIEVVGVEGLVDTLRRYSDMEDTLASIKPTRLYRALRGGFGGRALKADAFKGLGTVGAREGDFAQMLGLTWDAAQKENAAAAQLAQAAATASGPAR